MTLRSLVSVGLSAIVLQLGVAVLAWRRLGSGARVAVHFSANGTPDSYAGRSTAVMIFPVTTLLVLLVGAVRAQWEKSARAAELDRFMTAAAGCLLTVLHVVLLASGSGAGVSVPDVAMVGVALLLILLGVIMSRRPPQSSSGARASPVGTRADRWHREGPILGRGLLCVGASVLVLVPFATTLVQTVVLLAGLGVLAVVEAVVRHER